MLDILSTNADFRGSRSEAARPPPGQVLVVDDNPATLASLGPVLANPTELNQVLVNLCINARDAMPAGGTLTLAGRNHVASDADAAQNPEVKPGPYVVVSVSDTGTGIPSHVRDRIFEPFFSTKAPGCGTGLGLSTVLGIVRSNGSFVSIATEEGKGTTFELHLPAYTASPAVAASAPATRVPRGSGELVLVVDDERSVRTALEHALRECGYRVVTARDGVDAVARFMTFGPEIRAVVTDMIMPRLGGHVVSQAIRKSYPDTRIIGISGWASEEVVERPQSIGIDIFVAKPFTCDEIVRALHTVLAPDYRAGTPPAGTAGSTDARVNPA